MDDDHEIWLAADSFIHVSSDKRKKNMNLNLVITW